jgi:hydrogenase 3 maturation protease
VVVFGVGHDWRGDDAWGLWVARRLAGRVSALVVEVGEVPEAYLHRVPKGARLVLLDAVRFGGRPGEVRFFRPLEGAVTLGLSTHRLPLSVLAEYLSCTKRVETWVLGVQPAMVEWGAPMSAPVREAGQRVLAWLPAWIRAGCPLPLTADVRSLHP